MIACKFSFVSVNKTGVDSHRLASAGNSSLLHTASLGLLSDTGCPMLLPAKPEIQLLSLAQKDAMWCMKPRSLTLHGVLSMNKAFADPQWSLCSSHHMKKKKKSCICMERSSNYPLIFPSRKVSWPCSNLHLIPSLTACVLTPNWGEFSKSSTYLWSSEAGYKSVRTHWISVAGSEEGMGLGRKIRLWMSRGLTPLILS